MFGKEKIVISMTSYPGRITNIGKSMFFLLNKQTIKPDEIHLWLASPEFPNKEKDLPEDLRTILKLPNIFLHWLPKNTYCHKRHEYFKIANDNDLVFLVDDDVKYDDKLIESVLNAHKKFDNTIICYNYYPQHVYIGKRIIYKPVIVSKVPLVNKDRWCGQSMIPAKIYPKECLSDANQAIRDKADPVSDECWLQPWIVYYDIPLFHVGFSWGTDIDPKIDKWDGMCKFSHEKEANGLERRDNWLAAVLNAIPKLKEKYKKLFNYG